MSGEAYAKLKSWAQRNPDKKRAIDRRYREKHKKDIREQQRRWRERNPEEHKRRRKQHKIKRQLMLEEYQAERGCVICGNNDIRCLVFHHRNPDKKSFGISAAMAKGYGMNKIWKEIEKCDVVCRNCHAILHYAIIEN